MNMFNIGDLVKHKDSEECVFKVVDVWESVPRGLSRLYKVQCVNADRRKRYTYHESELRELSLPDVKRD